MLIQEDIADVRTDIVAHKQHMSSILTIAPELYPE